MYRGVPDAPSVPECGKKASLELSFRFRNQPFFWVKQKMMGWHCQGLLKDPICIALGLGLVGNECQV
jgi:hypothetical protein